MNVSYTYIDGKAIISDKNGNQVPIEYYDNLDEVLVQENIIETIENKIKDLGDIKTLPQKRFIPFITISMTIGILISPLILNLILMTNIYTTFVNSIFGKINLFKIIASICEITMGPIALYCDIYNHQNYNNFVKHNNAKACELEFLKKQLIEEKQKLKNLKKEKNKEKNKEKENSNFRVVKVNDIEELRQLKHYIKLYYNLGYNLKKLYKLFKNDTLEDELSKYYNNDDIQLAKLFVEKNGPKLIKKIK